MKEIFEFIKTNWQLILAALVFILSFILQLIKKKPVNDIQYLIFEWSIEAVKIAESSGKDGFNKLAIAVRYVLSKLKGNFPELNVEAYREGTISIIEDLLSTPQKKEK